MYKLDTICYNGVKFVQDYFFYNYLKTPKISVTFGASHYPFFQFLLKVFFTP